MIPLRIITGDATRPQSDGPKVIAHVCNDIGGWGRGFVSALSRRWPEPERAYRTWYRYSSNVDRLEFKLGATRLVWVEHDIWVANMIAQHGVGRTLAGVPPIRYEALEECLDALFDMLPANATVHMPRIGCGLAGGSWDKVEPIVERMLCARNISVTVYDPA